MSNIYRLNRPPHPTPAEPYIQIHWVFYQVYSEMKLKASKSVIYAQGKYLEFLTDEACCYEELKRDKRFFLEKYWQLDALIRFNRWLRQQPLASKTKYQVYKSVRLVMNTAYSLSVIDNVIYNEPFDKGIRETETNTAFDADVETKISLALDKWIYLAVRVLNGYSKTGEGIPTRDGRGKYKDKLSLDGVDYSTAVELATAYGLKAAIVQRRLNSGYSIEEAVKAKPKPIVESGISKEIVVEGITYPSIAKAEKAYNLTGVSQKLKKGYSIEEAFNIRPRFSKAGSIEHGLWLFENQFDCDPEAMLLHVRNDINNSPFKMGDLSKYFLQWGVWYGITRDLVMPLAVKLIALTGLNLESVKSLTLSSYQEEHPLTGQPVITYRKSRSESNARTIDRELHIPTLEIEEYFVENKIQNDIHALIQLTIELTKPLRDLADDEIKDKLFIFEHSMAEKKGQGDIHSLDNQHLVTGWINSFPKKNGLVDQNNESIIFNTTKFRPTIASNMVNQGADIFQVSVVLGHRNISTTARYLSEHRLTPEFNKKMSKAIEGISKRSIEHQSKEKPNRNLIGFEPIKTLSGCSCKDPYNPSDTIKQSTNYQEGSLCKYWNMCLLCDSSIVTESGLPKLINYKLELEESLAKNKPQIQSRKELVASTIELIEAVLQPDEIFPEAAINNAYVLASELDDIEIDQLVYQGMGT